MLSRGLESCVCSQLHVLGRGLDDQERQKRQDLYGLNVIDIQIKPVLHLVVFEVKSFGLPLLHRATQLRMSKLGLCFCFLML